MFGVWLFGSVHSLQEGLQQNGQFLATIPRVVKPFGARRFFCGFHKLGAGQGTIHLTIDAIRGFGVPELAVSRRLG